MLIQHAKALIGNEFQTDVDIRIGQGVITEIGQHLAANGDEVLDAAGKTVLPGFVDVHIHGCVGCDTMRGEADIRKMARFLRTTGVAAFCPTTMSASIEDTRSAIQAIRAVMDRPEPEGSMVLGAHMEAPFLDGCKCGAQRREFFMNPSMEHFNAMTGEDYDAVCIMTLAPEREGSEAFIREATAKGVAISVGHTSATGEQTHRAADWGATRITHTFNAQTPLHHREPGVVGAALSDDRFYCELICDGIHLHPDILRLTSKAKGMDKTVVVSDSMEAAGMPDGQYDLGGQAVFVKDGAARLASGTLAGSVLTMPVAFRNLIRFGLEPLQAAVMCTRTPAESINNHVAGRIAVGSPAPLTMWSADWQDMQVIG